MATPPIIVGPVNIEITGALDVDGTLNVDSTATLVGDVTVTGDLMKLAGTSSNDAAVGGVLYMDTSTPGNVGVGEDTLGTYTVPANTLSVNGESLWFEAGGTLAGNGNTKTVRVRFGAGASTEVYNSGNITGGANPFWYVKGRITRTGAAIQTSICFGGAFGIFKPTWVTTDATLSGGCVLKITGEAVADNDIVQKTFIVGWDDNNT